MRTVISLVILAGVSLGEDPLVGYRQQGMKYQGPGAWPQPVEPISVYAYHTLRLTYRATGLPKSAAAILTLRPGSVGPVTPGATNPENPFVAGLPVVAITARDLAADDAPHTVEIELYGKMRTAQIDQLQFSLPAGARLMIEDLQFRGAQELLPCQAGGPGLPEKAASLATRGPSLCAGWPATSLRSRESIRIEGAGRKGRTLYLSLMAHLAGLSAERAFPAHQVPDCVRLKESSEIADVVARVNYADGSEEEQFPLLVAERRHALLNRTAALYALDLDPRRAISTVDLLDRSVHAQLVVFAAGLSQAASPQAVGEMPPAVPSAARRPAGEPSLEGSKWYRITSATGEALSGAVVRADLHVTPEPGGRSLSLSLTNTSQEPREFMLAFPSVAVRPAADPGDVYYVFPLGGAVIARDERTLEAVYSSAFPLQFLDVFAPAANRGACVMVRDTSGRWKKFRLKKSAARVETDVEYKVRLGPGETFRPPDATVILHGGDWHEGFEAYRNWLKTWYKPMGPRPAWLRSAFWARRDYPLGGSGRLFDEPRNRYTFEELIRDGQAFGGIDFIDISGFSLTKTVGRVGDYTIELGGVEDLRRNVAQAEAAGIPTGLYFAGYHIDRRSSIFRRFGPQWQLIDEKGQALWWPGEVEAWICPHIPAWQQFLAGRIASVAGDVGVAAVYLDVFGTPSVNRATCYSASHGHPPGLEPTPGEIAMAKEVRRRLDAAGLRTTMIYLEHNPPDAAAPYYDAAFCYALPHANRLLSPLKLNLWRFAFPDIRLWDMLSIGVEPRVLSAEDFRLSLWHGNGVWLKGHSETWYGEDLLAFLRRARGILKQHAAAFSGAADPLVSSPHPAVFVNRFTGDKETVYTLFNASYRTVRFSFLGRERTLGPRDVDVVVGTESGKKLP